MSESGGARPAEGDSAQDEARRGARCSRSPASTRSAVATEGFAPLGSDEVPTWQVPQCVLDLMWQTRS